MSDILACRCSNCGDVWDLGKELHNMPSSIDKLNFISSMQKCLMCGEEYSPYGHIFYMHDFVFEAVKTVKM